MIVEMNNKLKRKLEYDFPELIVTDVKEIGEGWDNIACLVNNETVFRVPKKSYEDLAQGIIDHTKAEIKFLRKVENKLPAKTPIIRYVAKDEVYYGYAYIDGSQVSLEKLADKERFVKLWIDTAIAISNSMTVDQAKELGIKLVTLNEYRLNRVRQVAENGILDKGLQELAEDTLNGYLKAWDKAPQFILHGDPGLGNWIYDEESKKFTLVDWSDLCVGPQEFQMYRLINDMPEYIDLACSYYFDKTGLCIDKNLLFLCGNASILSMLGAFLEREGQESTNVKKKIDQLKFWKSLQA